MWPSQFSPTRLQKITGALFLVAPSSACVVSFSQGNFLGQTGSPTPPRRTAAGVVSLLIGEVRRQSCLSKVTANIQVPPTRPRRTRTGPVLHQRGSSECLSSGGITPSFHSPVLGSRCASCSTANALLHAYSQFRHPGQYQERRRNEKKRKKKSCRLLPEVLGPTGEQRLV